MAINRDRGLPKLEGCSIDRGSKWRVGIGGETADTSTVGGVSLVNDFIVC